MLNPIRKRLFWISKILDYLNEPFSRMRMALTTIHTRHALQFPPNFTWIRVYPLGSAHCDLLFQSNLFKPERSHNSCHCWSNTILGSAGLVQSHHFYTWTIERSPSLTGCNEFFRNSRIQKAREVVVGQVYWVIGEHCSDFVCDIVDKTWTGSEAILFGWLCACSWWSRSK